MPTLRVHNAGRHRRQGGLWRKAHSEPLPSLADRKAPRAFHLNPARKARPHSPLSMTRSRPGVMPLQTCPPPAGQTSLPPTTISRLKAAPTEFFSALQAGGVCETRRIRSHYLLPDGARTSRSLKIPPPEGQALLYTINAATMRPCRGDPPAFVGARRVDSFRSNQLSNRAAIGILLPMPKALDVTLSPGAACLRLYSFRSTVRITHLTVSGSKSSSRIFRME